MQKGVLIALFIALGMLVSMSSAVLVLPTTGSEVSGYSVYPGGNELVYAVMYSITPMGQEVYLGAQIVPNAGSTFSRRLTSEDFCPNLKPGQTCLDGLFNNGKAKIAPVYALYVVTVQNGNYFSKRYAY